MAVARLIDPDSVRDGAAGEGGSVGEQMQIQPDAVAAAGRRLGAAADELRMARDRATEVRFGPAAVPAPLRDHGVVYAAGMRDVGAVIASMALAVTALADGLDSAAADIVAGDAAVAGDISSADTLR